MAWTEGSVLAVAGVAFAACVRAGAEPLCRGAAWALAADNARARPARAIHRDNMVMIPSGPLQGAEAHEVWAARHIVYFTIRQDCRVPCLRRVLLLTHRVGAVCMMPRNG